MAAKIKRSSIPDIRKAMLDRGALLFRFEKPSNVNHKREHIVWFEQMQEAGFIVTTLGCILPYENFRGSSKGRPKGHKISAYFFLGEPSQQHPNEHPHGWPMETQVSHRCHRKDCINPTHIVYEPQWKNLKRNYCGEQGTCDCGVRPTCLATYHNDAWKRYNDELITYSVDGYRGRVAKLIPGRRFVILPRNHYESVDNKKRKRNERLHNKRKKNTKVPPSLNDDDDDVAIAASSSSSCNKKRKRKKAKQDNIVVV